MTPTGTPRLVGFISAAWVLLAISFLNLSATGAASLTPGDATLGKALFERRCAGCHALDKNKEGPRLSGVYGRKAGSLSDFSYSEPLRASHLTWDEVSLDKWLANPEAVVPDNDMAFRVSNPQERADIIRFLRLSSGK